MFQIVELLYCPSNHSTMSPSQKVQPVVLEWTDIMSTIIVESPKHNTSIFLGTWGLMSIALFKTNLSDDPGKMT